MIKRKKYPGQFAELFSRRDFLKRAAIGATVFTFISDDAFSNSEKNGEQIKIDFPIVDYHVHLSGGFNIERAVELSKKRGIKFGIVEHPGPGYKIVNDEALKEYIDMLKNYPVYKGLQPVYPNWAKTFSKELLFQLDYILMDALTLPEKDGSWLRIWRADTKVADKEAFMKRYVDFNLQILSDEPIDIFAWPTFLPACIAEEYDTLWTNERMQKIIDIAVKKEIAIEINEQAKVPKIEFVNMAKKAGAKFTFGTDSRNDKAGQFEYCLQIAQQAGLAEKDMFVPKPDGKKAIQRKTMDS
jgi:histidinol phosphatase-like PHP family hydrolase